MSKKNFYSVLVVFAAMIFTSCSSSMKSTQSSPVNARNVDLDPIKADIKVNEDSRLSGKSSYSYLLFFKLKGENNYVAGVNFNNGRFVGEASRARAAAAYDAMSKGDYDLLISPNFTITKKNYLGIFRTYDVSVTGYGAKYHNFRTEAEPIPGCCPEDK